MKLAIPVCGQNVALVFDDADDLLIIETAGNELHKEDRLSCATGTSIERANQLIALGVDLLICGAISCPLQRTIEVSGIEIIPFVRGNAAEVFEAYCRKRLGERCFSLPGRNMVSDGKLCRGLKRQYRHRGKRN